MYPFCKCHNANYSDSCSEPTSESEDAYDVEACIRYKKNRNIDNLDYCDCCESRKNKKKMAKGKFGLAYVLETPKQTITKPAGWQVEFQDTPSKIENNCETMLKWVNRPPLGECSAFNDYPKECAAFLECNERKSKTSKYYGPTSGNDNIDYKKFHRQAECSSKPDRVCVICEKCKKNSRRSPRKSTATYCVQKDTVCLCDQLDQQILQNRHCCCFDPKEIKCKYCQKEQSNVCSKCCNPKLLQEEKKSKFKHRKDESDLDYVPKKDDTIKKAKNTQTRPMKSKNYEEPDRAEKKEDKNDKPIVHKIETKAVVDIRFSDKGVEVKNPEIIKSSTFEVDDKVKKVPKAQDQKVKSIEPPNVQNQDVKSGKVPKVQDVKSIEVAKDEDQNVKSKKIPKTQDQEVQKFENFQKELEQKLQERAEKIEAEQPKEIVEQLLEEIPEKVVKSSKEDQDVANVELNEDTKGDEYKMMNHKTLPKKEIFTDDMTPLQKLKLAMKIQKQEILESKLAQNQPSESPEKLIDTVEL